MHTHSHTYTHACIHLQLKITRPLFSPPSSPSSSHSQSEKWLQRVGAAQTAQSSSAQRNPVPVLWLSNINSLTAPSALSSLQLIAPTHIKNAKSEQSDRHDKALEYWCPRLIFPQITTENNHVRSTETPDGFVSALYSFYHQSRDKKKKKHSVKMSKSFLKSSAEEKKYCVFVFVRP